MPPRSLLPGQASRIHTMHPDDAQPTLVSESQQLLLESPNWLRSGKGLVANADGRLWRLEPSSAGPVKPQPVAISSVPPLNNDHVLDPDGRHIRLSTYDRQLYRAPVDGGSGELTTTSPTPPQLQHFLHGVHPGGTQLAFVGIVPAPQGPPRGDIYTASSSGRDYRRLTSGPGHSDGCDYSADGEWIYFNTELFDGHAQIARMRPDGSELQQLTFDAHVNWFPHPSPDGTCAVYLAFAPGTAGHPPNVWVELRLVRADDWAAPVTIARVFGGQGTLNTPSWSPDGSAFAFATVTEPGRPERGRP